MTPATKQQRVFIVRGVRRILEIPAADILVCEKMTWARLRIGGKRYLLGTSAFFTRKAAEVRKLGELRKMAARPVLPSHMGGNATLAARDQLQKYKETGTLH